MCLETAYILGFLEYGKLFLETSNLPPKMSPQLPGRRKALTLHENLIIFCQLPGTGYEGSFQPPFFLNFYLRATRWLAAGVEKWLRVAQFLASCRSHAIH